MVCVQLESYRDIAGGAANELARAAQAVAGLPQRILQLEQRNQELESFVHSLAHDSGALARAIALRAHMLAERLGTADADTTALVDTIMERAGRLSGLCEGLLRLARMEQRALEWHEIDLSGLALEVAAELRRDTPARQVRFDLEPGLVAWGDRTLVRLVLDNLLGNAWKYTAGNPQARIELGRRCDETEQVYYVVDNGIGFSAEDAQSLFAPFGRLRSASSFAGSGLGLTIVKRVLERHGGWIRASGSVGRGAEFVFSLGAAPACH